MKKIIASLIIGSSLMFSSVAFAKQPTTPHCYINPLYGTGGYQPYFLCSI